MKAISEMPEDHQRIAIRLAWLSVALLCIGVVMTVAAFGAVGLWAFTGYVPPVHAPVIALLWTTALAVFCFAASRMLVSLI